MASIIESDHSTGNWIFSKEHIEKHTPSRKDGIDAKKESWLRKGCCTFIQDAGMRLNVPQLTIATAIMFCHRFFMRQSYTQHDRYVIASTCLFLAGKVEDTPRQLKDVIYVTYIIRHKKDKGAEDRVKQTREVFEHERELLLSGEYLVMNTLSFDLNINHPYKPLLSTIRQFDNEAGPVKHLAQVAWNFVNDGLRTSLGLQFKPHHVAAGAIYLAAKFLKINLPQEGGKPWWTKFNVTPAVLEDVSSQMLELYEQTKDGSGTTGASSRRQSKGQPAASKAGAGSKSKTSGHPSTPSLADRAPQASLTSAASMQAGTRAGEVQRVGWAQEAQREAARGGAQQVGAAAKAEPAGGAVDKESGKAAAFGPATGLPPKPEQNGHAPRDSALLTAAHGLPRPSEDANGRKPGQEGVLKADAFAQNGATAGESSKTGLQKDEDEGRLGPAELQLGADPVQGGPPSSDPKQQGRAKPVFLTGEALDEALDMDLEDAGSPGARRDTGRSQPSRDPPDGGSQGPALPLEQQTQPGGEGPAAAAGADKGREAGQGEGQRPSTSGRSGEAGQVQGKDIRDSKGEARTPAAGAEQASEEGEIAAEDGEIPASPLSQGRHSPSRAEQEQRAGRSRSRERSPTRSRDRSRSWDARKRKQGRYSRSRSPADPSRGRSRSPYRSERRQSIGQRQKHHDGRSRGKEHSEYRERDRERERGRDRYRPPHKDSSCHAPRYNDAYDRNRR